MHICSQFQTNILHCFRLVWELYGQPISLYIKHISVAKVVVAIIYWQYMLGVVVHASNSKTWVAEAGGSQVQIARPLTNNIKSESKIIWIISYTEAGVYGFLFLPVVLSPKRGGWWIMNTGRRRNRIVQWYPLHTEHTGPGLTYFNTLTFNLLSEYCKVNWDQILLNAKY